MVPGCDLSSQVMTHVNTVLTRYSLAHVTCVVEKLKYATDGLLLILEYIDIYMKDNL
jgi:hypothetical protein